MTASTPLQAYSAALAAGSDALIDAVQSGADRGLRLSSTWLVEAQRRQLELLELTQSLFAEPTAVRPFYRRLREVADRQNARSREIIGQVNDELGRSRHDARDTIARLAAQQRIADDATAEIVRGMINGIIDRAEALLQRGAQRAGARPSAASAAAPKKPARKAKAGSKAGARRAATQGRTASKKEATDAVPQWLSSSDGDAPAKKKRRSRVKGGGKGKGGANRARPSAKADGARPPDGVSASVIGDAVQDAEGERTSIREGATPVTTG